MRTCWTCDAAFYGVLCLWIETETDCFALQDENSQDTLAQSTSPSTSSYRGSLTLTWSDITAECRSELRADPSIFNVPMSNQPSTPVTNPVS